MKIRLRTLVAAAALATAVSACGEQTHRLLGAFILNDSAVAYDESSCSGTGEYSDIRDGLPVVVMDEAGKVLGSAALKFAAQSSASQCVYTWEMTVGVAKSYSIEVGERDGGTYPVEDLNRRYWQVATTVGD